MSGKVNLKPFDPAKYLTDAESQDELMADALASGHAPYIEHAKQVIARARFLAATARDVDCKTTKME